MGMLFQTTLKTSKQESFRNTAQILVNHSKLTTRLKDIGSVTISSKLVESRPLGTQVTSKLLLMYNLTWLPGLGPYVDDKFHTRILYFEHYHPQQRTIIIKNCDMWKRRQNCTERNNAIWHLGGRCDNSDNGNSPIRRILIGGEY